MEWISVDKELPEKRKEVIGALKGCNSGKYIIRPIERVDADDHDWESEGFEIANCWDITHWQPQLEPPQENSNG